MKYMVIATSRLIMLSIGTIYIIFQYLFAIKLIKFLNQNQYNKSDKMMMGGIFSLIFGDTIHVIYLYINYI